MNLFKKKRKSVTPKIDDLLVTTVYNIRSYDYNLVSKDKTHIDAFFKALILSLFVFDIQEDDYKYILEKSNIDLSKGMVNALNQIVTKWEKSDRLPVELWLRVLEVTYRDRELKKEFINQREEVETLILNTLKPLIDYSSISKN